MSNKNIFYKFFLGISDQHESSDSNLQSDTPTFDAGYSLSIGLLILGLLSLLYCINNFDTYPQGIGHSPFFWTMFIFIAASFGSFLSEKGKRTAKAAQEAKAVYDDSLKFLSANPHDPTARLKCLENGRIYYGLAMPDTYTAHFSSNGVVGTSDHQNNTAGREARINADIEARIGIVFASPIPTQAKIETKINDDLEKLVKFKEQGVLSDEEFQKAKAKLLAS